MLTREAWVRTRTHMPCFRLKPLNITCSTCTRAFTLSDHVHTLTDSQACTQALLRALHACIHTHTNSHACTNSHPCTNRPPCRPGLTLADFIAEYEEPNLPVVIPDASAGWPALSRWTVEALSQAHGHDVFRCGAVDMVFNDFVAYLGGCRDDRPLYLFDCRFGEKCPDLATDYTVPPYFAEVGAWGRGGTTRREEWGCRCVCVLVLVWRSVRWCWCEWVCGLSVGASA